jgi:Transglycosylase-like domain
MPSRGLPGIAITLALALAMGAMVVVIVVGVATLITAAQQGLPPETPTPTVTVTAYVGVPGPVTTVTARPTASPSPRTTASREASPASRERQAWNTSREAFLRCVVKRESGGNPKAENPVSTASGLFQFLDGTWRAYSEQAGIGTQYARASDAPAAVQWELARWVVKHKGRYPWKPTVPGTAC